MGQRGTRGESCISVRWYISLRNMTVPNINQFKQIILNYYHPYGGRYVEVIKFDNVLGIDVRGDGGDQVDFVKFPIGTHPQEMFYYIKKERIPQYQKAQGCGKHVCTCKH